MKYERKAQPEKGKPAIWITILKRAGALLGVTLLCVVLGLYGLMFVLAKGPSPSARNLFVRSVRETSAMYWLADLFFSKEEIAQMEHVEEAEELESTDTSLISISTTEPADGPAVDAWGLCDEDGDGIILEQVRRTGFVGYMMVVLDPSRIMMGTPHTLGAGSMTVDQMCREYNCIGGINGGGFMDQNGSGDGSTPDGMVIVDGVAKYANDQRYTTFVGFDKNYILHTGRITKDEAARREIQFGCSFGPVLVANGERNDDAVLNSGVNPRTAIGQRQDGAVLLLVVDGRQAHSLGATYSDLADVMLHYGAVNACNLDGGSSTVMWYDGEWVNSSASVVGVRPVPTAFLVKEAAK